MTSAKYLRKQYIFRINRVIDYIETHLNEPLTLQELAQIACFSQFHFHRIFSALMGETLQHFIHRIRVERAAAQLITNPKASITTIALENGFSSSATFARSFQKRYKMSASQWRAGGYLQNSKNCKMNRKEGKDIQISYGYIGDAFNKKGTPSLSTLQISKEDSMKKTSPLSTTVRIETLPDYHVAYVRHVGPYKGDSNLFQRLWEKLFHWAAPRGLIQQPDLKMFSVYHDSPEITDESNLRTSICMTIPSGTQTDEEIGTMKIEGGVYALGYFEIDVTQYEEAWGFMYGDWLPESGYQPDDRPPFELNLNDPQEHPEKKHIFNICIPVKPL